MIGNGGEGSYIAYFNYELILMNNGKAKEATPILRKAAMLAEPPKEQAIWLNNMAVSLLDNDNPVEALHWLGIAQKQTRKRPRFAIASAASSTDFTSSTQRKLNSANTPA